MTRNTFLFIAVALLLALPAAAQISMEKLQIHGFGGFSYGNTNNENEYLDGQNDGEYHFQEFNISFDAQPTDKLTIFTQFAFDNIGVEEGIETNVDFAFAQWQFSDAFKLRVGRVKQPFGIYNEIEAVGTLRPFYHLPQGIYGPEGIVGTGYDGAGVTGSHHLGKDWALEYDIYGGALNLDVDESFKFFLDEPLGEENEQVNNLIGGGLTFSLPAKNINFGVSTYTGTEEIAESVVGGRHYGVDFHVEYLTELWSIRSEYLYYDDQFQPEPRKVNAAYVEVARYLTPNIQVAGRYDYSHTKLPTIDTSAAPSLLDQKDVAVALNYWFNPNLVIKLNLHFVDGNRYALPEDLATAIAEGTLDKKTHLLLLGAQFSF